MAERNKIMIQRIESDSSSAILLDPLEQVAQAENTSTEAGVNDGLNKAEQESRFHGLKAALKIVGFQSLDTYKAVMDQVLADEQKYWMTVRSSPVQIQTITECRGKVEEAISKEELLQIAERFAKTRFTQFSKKC